jgi:hypothetical protein
MDWLYRSLSGCSTIQITSSGMSAIQTIENNDLRRLVK